MKKILISLLACLLCLGMLASCGGENTSTTATTGTTGINVNNGGNDGPAAPQNLLYLSKDRKSDYQIVVSADAEDAIVDLAYEFRWLIKQLAGIELPVVEDTADAKDCEIILGDTARKALYTAPDEDYLAGCAAFVSGQRIVFEGASASGVSYAMRTFAIECLGCDMDGEDIYFTEPVDTLTCPDSYEYVKAFYTMFSDALSATIVYDGSYMQKRLAYVLRDQLKADLSTSAKDPVPTLVTKANEATVEGNIIELVVDKKLEDGKWHIEIVDESRVVLSAKDYYGFVGGARKLANYFDVQENFITKDQTDGDYRDTLTEAEKGSAYAFDQQGEYRVMFYNVLWDNTDVTERINLNTTVVNTYMPDVLGLQEMNKNKRGVTLRDGSGGLIAELKKIGYVEAVDPRVKNAYDKGEYIPGTDAYATTGANAGTPLKGYGTSGATWTTYDGESYYTFFNCAPLLYNTNTTTLIEAEYYWYKNQWDKRPGQSHENWANDCGSKAATWGVFEDKATGERYIVISTHMCTRSDYIRGLQAQELVDLLEKLTERYDYPVLLGGDYNGNYTAANHVCFEANGYVDVEQNNLASVYTSKVQGHHRPYPAYDKEKESVQPTADDDSGKNSSSVSVDHIMIGNVDEGELDIYVFGVVIDECSKSGADHFPMYMDFSINSKT